MPPDEGPVQLDANVVYKEKPPGGPKRKKRSGVLIVAAVGAILVIALLLYQPENSGFIDSPPPLEQEERDSVASVASRIISFRDQNDSLPLARDIDLPPGFRYQLEDSLVWSLETPGGLYYTSDMDIHEFQGGTL